MPVPANGQTWSCCVHVQGVEPPHQASKGKKAWAKFKKTFTCYH